MEMIIFTIVIMLGIVIYIGGVLMAAIDNLTQAISDLNATIAGINITNQDAAIQSAADAVVAANASLKTKLGG